MPIEIWITLTQGLYDENAAAGPLVKMTPKQSHTVPAHLPAFSTPLSAVAHGGGWETPSTTQSDCGAVSNCQLLSWRHAKAKLLAFCSDSLLLFAL